MTLDTVNVQGEAANWAVLTEGRDSYTAAVTTTGTGGPTAWKEIPQSITTVTSQRIQDQNLSQLDDAMRKTTGMVVLTNDQGRSSIVSRGYEIDQMLVNGLYAPLSSIYGTQPDLAIFDRVDVLKGPAGLFYGGAAIGGGPGGVINGVLKPATSNYTLNGDLTYGSWDFTRAEVDAGGKLNEAGTVRARIVGAFQSKDGFLPNNDNQVWVGYGTLAFDITDNTTLSLYAWHQERDVQPFNGLPGINLGGGVGQLLNVSRSTYVGATWNDFHNESTDYLAELVHRLDNGGEAKISARYSDRYVDYRYAFGASAISTAPATYGNFSMQYTAAKYWETSLAADAHISTPFELFGQSHNLTVGADYRQVETSLFAPTSTSLTGTYNINNFNIYSVPNPTTLYNRDTETDPSQWGLYSQLKINPLDQLHVLLGGRLSWYDNTSTVTTANTSSGARTVTNTPIGIDGKFTPYAGLVVDLTPNVSAYGSYTGIFVPQTELDASGNTLDPREGYQYEVGLKGTFLDGALNTSAALFLIHDNNRALATNVASVYVPAGEVEVQGAEFEVSGKLAPGWEVYAGYTYTDTKYLTASASQVNTAFSTYTPKDNLNIWTKYEFQNPTLRNAWIAGGVKAVSSFYVTNAGVTMTQGAYQVWDAQLGYKFNDHLKASFTVTNLFDEVYYSRVGSTALFNFYGEPRAFWLKVSGTY
ncbi:TonB-dependent siderophore receptor [Azorhizobium oxalatiphilum]|uniref:TonB-dependent siderophore receptor n=1 Tax=Azorhizobium oxalatiphilum TaxID=980631 RepID=UPI001662EF96|nr:TonB-dependent siderophore receptor [Azorhizobium oxalatiphilum]